VASPEGVVHAAPEESAPGPEHGSTEVRLVFHQGDRLAYRFCTPAWRLERQRVAPEALLAAVEAVDPGRCRRFTLAEGALAHPALGAVLGRLRARGLQRLTLETDGRPLAREGVLAGLQRAGVDTLFLYVGGRSKRIHEQVLQDPGGFEAATLGLERALASGLGVYLVVPVLRWTQGALEPLLAWLTERPTPPRGLLLDLPEVRKVPEPLRRVLLSYGEVSRLAARVFDRCRRQRLEYGFATKRGVLPCLSDGALDAFGTVFFDRLTYLRHGHDPEDRFERLEACEACSVWQSCSGVESAYREAFGAEGARPVPLGVSMDWKLKRINHLEAREYKNVSAFDNDLGVSGRSLLRINGHCNMSCAFCFVDRTVPDYPEDLVLRAIDALAARNRDHLVLSGGEPTLHPQLPRFIARGRALGFGTIELQSNGVRAADFEYAKALVDAGLNKVTVSLHSIDPEHSDRITRLPGAFHKTVQAMKHFRRLGVLTQVAHVLTKSNYQELSQTVRFLRETFPEDEGHLSICFGVAQPISDLVYTWVMPTFDELRPYVRPALDYCLDTAVGFGGMLGQGGYPPCMLDGEMKYYARNLGHIYRSKDDAEQFYKAPRCRECSFDPWCVGVRKDYVATYGDHELRPFQTPVEPLLPEPLRARALPVVQDHEVDLAAPSPPLLQLRPRSS
jgi:MoaA/NifB/PqqE/SkfB family radical SAM enzyme